MMCSIISCRSESVGRAPIHNDYSNGVHGRLLGIRVNGSGSASHSLFSGLASRRSSDVVLLLASHLLSTPFQPQLSQLSAFPGPFDSAASELFFTQFVFRFRVVYLQLLSPCYSSSDGGKIHLLIRGDTSQSLLCPWISSKADDGVGHPRSHGDRSYAPLHRLNEPYHLLASQECANVSDK